MEVLNVTKLNKNQITPIILFFLMTSCLCHAQKDSDEYFSSYKGGKMYKKKTVFVLYDDDFSADIKDKKVTFSYKNKVHFIHDQSRHKKTVKKESKDKFSSTKVDSLFRVEKNFLDRIISEIEDKHNFRPVYPLKHIALKVFLLKKEKDHYKCYEVEWYSNNF